MCMKLPQHFPDFPLVAQMVKNLLANTGDLGLIPGSGRSPGAGNGYPLQYSHLENPMDGGAWWATVYGVAKSRAWLSDKHFRVLCTRSKWVAEEKQSLKYMATRASLQKIHPIISHVKLNRRFGFHTYLIKIEILLRNVLSNVAYWL